MNLSSVGSALLIFGAILSQASVLAGVLVAGLGLIWELLLALSVGLD